MSTFDAGRVEATLHLDRSPFQRGVKEARSEAKKLAGEKFRVTLDADTSPATRKVNALRQRIDRLTGTSVRIDVDTAKASAGLSALQQKVDRLSGGSIKINADTSAARGKLDALQQQARRLSNGTIRIDADTAKASAALTTLQGKVNRLSDKSVTITVNTDAAHQKLNALGAHIARLSGTHRIKLEVDFGGAAAGLTALRTLLNSLTRLPHTVRVDADTGSASAQLAALRAQLAALNSQQANARVGINGGGRASLILAAIVAGLGAVGYAAPAAAAALATVPAALTGAGQVVGTVLAGFSGVGDAMKALEQQEKSGASTAVSAGNQRAAAARQIASAQDAVAQAVQQQARTSIQAAQQVASAERALGQAVAQQARTRITSAQQVRSAQQALADAQVAAAQRVASAERTLESAQRTRQAAQEALTRATQDAVKANRDLQLSVAGAALSEERAALSLAQARERLAASSATGLERQDLELSVREAEQNLREVKVRYGDLRDEQNEFSRTGVAGTRQVRDATQALADAQRGVADAQRGITDAQREGAQQVTAAQERVAQAAQQAAWANEDAARAVADAQLGVQQAVQQAAWSQQDAARQVEQAQRGLADAYASAAEGAMGGAKASDAAAAALAKLTPEGREFVGFMRNEWKPAWREAFGPVQAALLPRLTDGMRRMIGLAPTLSRGLQGTAVVLGDLAIEGGKVSEQPWFRGDLLTIMESNNRSLWSLGQAGLSSAGAMVTFGAAASPVTEHMARLVEYSAQAWESFIVGKTATGELTQFLWEASERAGEFWAWIKQVAGGVWNVSQGLAPLGGALLYVTGNLAETVGWLARLNPTLTSFVVGAGLAWAAASKLGTALVAMRAASAAGGISALAGTLGTLLNPAALLATQRMQNMNLFLQTLGAGFGMSNAGATKFAGVVTRLAASLPLVGAAVLGLVMAHDALTTSSSEAAEALLQGGVSASKMRAELAENDATMARNRAWMPGWLADLEEWTRGNLGIMTTTEQANAELERQIATMGPLEAAQARATLAQTAYEDAVKNFTANSPQAQSAQRALSDATRTVESAQEAARRATMNATQALQDQQTKALAAIDARLGERQAVLATRDAQNELARALAEGGPGSDAAAQASLRLEQAQSSQAQAAMRAATEEAKRRGETDTSRAATDALGRSVGDMVKATKGQLSPALADMVNQLDAAGLSAAGAQVKIDAAGRAVAVFPGGKTVVLDANASAVPGQLAFVKQLVDSTRGTIGVDANTATGMQKVGNFKLTTDMTTGVVKVDGNITPADQQRLGIKAKTDGTTGTMWINGNPVPADGQLNGARFRVDTTTGVMSIDADPRDANRKSDNTHDRANNPETFGLDADTRRADGHMKSFWERQGDWARKIFGTGEGSFFQWTQTHVMGRAHGGPVAFAGGGPVLEPHQYATGGRVLGFPTGGGVRGPGSATSDSIPAMLSNGEYVIRAAAVRAVGTPALDAINQLAVGGLVAPLHLAAGGPARPDAAAPAAGPTPAAPTAAPAVAVDAAQQAAAASGMSAVTSAAATQAQTLVGTLVPALAATQLATTAAVLEQQRMVTAGVAPLAAAVVGTLLPALGVQAPAALGTLQGAQLATRTSTQQTQLQTQTSSTLMAAAVAAMSLASQAQHAGLRVGQALTRGSTVQTQLQTQGSHAAMTASTTGMSLASQAQLAGLRLGQLFTQQSTTATAQNTAGNNANMQATTGTMSAVNQSHLAGLRGAQGVTQAATTAFADAWRAQLGRTMPDSANPLRWVINFPIRGITDAWNNLDRQFALGKQVPPYVPRFATGGVAEGVRPGYTPGRDTHQIAVGGGEAIMRPEWTRVVGSDYVDAANHAARSGGLSGVQQFLGSTVTDNPKAEGRAKLDLMRRFPLDNGVKPPGFAYGGVAPHVAAAGNEITQRFGAMPGGIGGRGSRGNASDHPSGHALDFMTLGNYGLGDRVHGYLNANRGRMQVKYLIWKQRIDGRPMEDRGSPTANHMDHVHASFKGGPLGDGGGGGGFFDPTPIVDQAFAKVYRQIADIPKFFGPSVQVARDQGIARQGADKVRQKVLDQLMASMGGMMDVSGISGPVVEQVRQVAHRYGWGAGPNWDNGIFPLVAKESSWNPRAANPSSSARGLFQKMTSIHGPVEPTPAGQAAWGLNYIRGRYGTPSAAWAFHRRNNYYDDGGWLPPGASLAVNHTGKRENKAVFTEDQWKAMQGQAEAARRAPSGGDAPIDYERLAAAIAAAVPTKGDVHVHPRAEQSEQRIGEIARRELDWSVRT